MSLSGTICNNKFNNKEAYLMDIHNDEGASGDIFDTQIINESDIGHCGENLDDLSELNYDNFDKHLSSRLNESDCTICELVQDDWSESNSQNIKFQSPVNLINFQKTEELAEARISTPNRKGHHVNFPEEIITVSVPPPLPWILDSDKSTSDLIDAYTAACNKYNIAINNSILIQLQHILNFEERYDLFNLTNISLNWKACEALEEIFKHIQFKTIILDGTKMDEESSVIFFDLIRYYESCTNLFFFNDNNLGFFGWEACGRYVQQSSSLLHLKSINSLVCEQAAIHLQKGIQASSSLRILHLEGCIKSGRMLHLLSSAAEQCKTLTELNLSGNKLSATDGTHISYIILQNKNLEIIDLHSNNLQDAGVYYICNVFSSSTKLKYLNLSDNALTDICAKSLSSMLLVSKHLNNLLLTHNSINDTGVAVLVSALKENSTLSKINLSFTNITCISVIRLTNILFDCVSNLSDINVSGNVIHEEIRQHLDQALLHKPLMASSLDKENFSNISNLKKLQINNFDEKIENEETVNWRVVNKIDDNLMNDSCLYATLRPLSNCQECAKKEENLNSSLCTISIVSNANDCLVSVSNLMIKNNCTILNSTKIEASPNSKKRKFAVTKASLDPVK